LHYFALFFAFRRIKFSVLAATSEAAVPHIVDPRPDGQGWGDSSDNANS
jgi:hypothetical protein